MRISNIVRGIEDLTIKAAKFVATKAVDTAHGADSAKATMSEKLKDWRARRALRQVQKNIDLLNRMNRIANAEGKKFYHEVGPVDGPKPKATKRRRTSKAPA